MNERANVYVVRAVAAAATSRSSMCGSLTSISTGFHTHSSIKRESPERKKNAVISGVSNSLFLTIWHLFH